MLKRIEEKFIARFFAKNAELRDRTQRRKRKWRKWTGIGVPHCKHTSRYTDESSEKRHEANRVHVSGEN